MTAFQPNPVDQRVLDHVGEFPRSLFGDEPYQASELTDRYATAWARLLVQRLELGPELGEPRTVAELLRRRGFCEGFESALGWILERLARAGDLEASPGPQSPRYRLAKPWTDPELGRLREEGLAAVPGNLPTLDLLDCAGEAYPAVARGELGGQSALLGPAQAALWLRYFDNANPGYAIINRMAAIAASHRLPAEGPVRILEVGGGGGGATSALLDLLAETGDLDRVTTYRFTEPSPFFRRRAARRLAGRVEGLEIASLDLDLPWQDQEIAPDSFELVLGVNVMHVAHRLVQSLGQARRALVPGGWLVAGEAVRPFPDQALPAEMVFRLLPTFCAVEVDPVIRPRPGFLTPEEWAAALARAGFEEAGVVPDIARIREVYPRFFSGVVCGRRLGSSW